MNYEFRLPMDFEQRVLDAIVNHLEPTVYPSGYIPDRDVIAQALQVALWSSVLRDEGRATTFTINLRPGTIPSRVIPLQKPIEFSAAQLLKLSTATTSGVSAVHVGPGTERLEIFGIDTVLGNVSPVRIEILAPTTIAVKAADATVAFISGNNAELIDLDIYARYFFIDGPFPAESILDQDRERRFFDIARAMHRNGHGGILLVLASSTSAPGSTELSSLETHYLLTTPFHGLREIDAEETEIFSAMQATKSGSEARGLFSRLRAAELLHLQYISSLACTTAVDGATVVSSDGSLLAFGCKVTLSNAPSIRIRRPTTARATTVELTDFGGTRHQSAARYVGKYPGSRAIVLSQDGKVSILNHAGPDQVDCVEHAEWIF